MYLWYHRGKFGGCRQIPTQKSVGIKIVSPRQGHLVKMCRHLAFVATCRQHAGNFLSQGPARARSNSEGREKCKPTVPEICDKL